LEDEVIDFPHRLVDRYAVEHCPSVQLLQLQRKDISQELQWSTALFSQWSVQDSTGAKY